MKAFLGILSLLSLLSISIACNRDTGMADKPTDIQREDAIKGDDLRETDNYKKAVPAQDEEEVRDNRDTMDMGPNDSSAE